MFVPRGRNCDLSKFEGYKSVFFAGCCLLPYGCSRLVNLFASLSGARVVTSSGLSKFTMGLYHLVEEIGDLSEGRQC